MWDTDPSLFVEKCRVLSFFRIVGLSATARFLARWCHCLSSLFCVVSVSLAGCEEVPLPVFKVFQRKFSIYSCRFPVSLEGDEFRIFLCRCCESFFFFKFYFEDHFKNKFKSNMRKYCMEYIH